MSSSADRNWWYAIIISLSSAFLTNTGLIIQKWSLLQNRGQEFKKQPIWFLGLAMFLLGQIGHSVAFAIGPQSILGALAPFCLVTNFFVAPPLLGEKVTRLHYVSAFFIMSAVVIICSFSIEPRNKDQRFNNALVMHNVSQIPFLILFAFSITTVVLKGSQIRRVLQEDQKRRKEILDAENNGNEDAGRAPAGSTTSGSAIEIPSKSSSSWELRAPVDDDHFVKTGAAGRASGRGLLSAGQENGIKGDGLVDSVDHSAAAVQQPASSSDMRMDSLHHSRSTSSNNKASNARSPFRNSMTNAANHENTSEDRTRFSKIESLVGKQFLTESPPSTRASSTTSMSSESFMAEIEHQDPSATTSATCFQVEANRGNAVKDLSDYSSTTTGSGTTTTGTGGFSQHSTSSSIATGTSTTAAGSSSSVVGPPDPDPSAARAGSTTTSNNCPGLPGISNLQFSIVAALFSGMSVTSAKLMFGLLAYIIEDFAARNSRSHDHDPSGSSPSHGTGTGNGENTIPMYQQENNNSKNNFFVLIGTDLKFPPEVFTIMPAFAMFLFCGIVCTAMQNLGVFYYGALQSCPAFYGCTFVAECTYGLVFWQEYRFYGARNMCGVGLGYCLNVIGILMLTQITAVGRGEEKDDDPVVDERKQSKLEVLVDKAVDWLCSSMRHRRYLAARERELLMSGEGIDDLHLCSSPPAPVHRSATV
ncbi:unnamed protein product [Amoebophrya sp. A120]|nr:unnamed protein product [Amoebophrya sp. A120]|eukprot:GSA120T00007982001.1